MLPGCVLPQGVGEQGDIEFNSLMIVPETMDIRCLFHTDTPGKDHIEVGAGEGDIEAFCGVTPCPFFVWHGPDGRVACFVLGCYTFCNRG